MAKLATTLASVVLLSVTIAATQTPLPLNTLVAQAEKGDAEAQFALGKAYASRPLRGAFPWTAEQLAERTNDLAIAKAWHLKAALQGYADAQYELGRGLIFPEFVWFPIAENPAGGLRHFEPPNAELGVSWLRKAADQGHAAAQEALGRQARWLMLRPGADANLISVLTVDLHQGEAEAIALALEMRADRLLIDE
ncbi:MAG: hypothetical protein Q7R30_19365, partial [Acidobacteriota bacterium]|nr:hypothetical protein [Acidobacteriota bacterium]